MTPLFKLFSSVIIVVLASAPVLHSEERRYASIRETSPLPDKNGIEWYLPVNHKNRQSLEDIQLTNIGRYGLVRKARPGVPSHLHTGIDIKRPNDNYADEQIFPVAGGKVISLKDDGPYAQIIIQHPLEDSTSLWSVYEHIAGIQVKLADEVDPHRPIARFMTREELDRVGWQFDHLHLEIMKEKPTPRKPDKKRPFLYYGTYCLVCYNKADLDNRYYHPLEFFKAQWKTNP